MAGMHGVKMQEIYPLFICVKKDGLNWKTKHLFDVKLTFNLRRSNTILFIDSTWFRNECDLGSGTEGDRGGEGGQLHHWAKRWKINKLELVYSTALHNKLLLAIFQLEVVHTLNEVESWIKPKCNNEHEIF